MIPDPNALPEAFGRPNPLAWSGEEEAQGVFIGNAPDDFGPFGTSIGAKRRERRLIDPNATPGPALKAIVQAIHAALEAGEPAVLPLDGLSREDVSLLDDLLGEGEVTIVAGHDPLWQAHEAVMAGVWRVQAFAADGDLVHDRVEVGDVPRLVREAAAAIGRDMPPLPEEIAAGVMNAPAVLREIGDKAASWTGRGPNHVVNFTLLPMSEDDIALLTSTVGQAPLTIVSGGYGTARVYMTAVTNVWAVQYLNGAGTVILDTIEIGDVPASVRAAPEDFADSAIRLGELMDAYR
jgi:hydrogenase-1 operon protein HyaF